MREENETRPVSGTSDRINRGGRSIGRFLQDFLYPPLRRNDLQSYGQTLAERSPSLTKAEKERIITRNIGPAPLMVAALFAGILAGGAASLLKWGIASFSRLVTGFFHEGSLNWWFLLLPVMGLILVGLYQRHVIHREISHGDNRLRNDFILNRCYLPTSTIYNPIIACILTLGFGGSAGSEGPIAFSGAAIGSNVGAFLRISPSKVRMLTAIGAGAGIAGIFKAPVGGVLFTIEVLGIELTTAAVAALFLACVAASTVAYLLSGCTSDISFPDAIHISYDNIPMLILFGVICGIYSTYYSSTMGLVGTWLGRIRRPLIKNITAGIAVGCLVFLFPPLYGEGYGLGTSLLNGKWDSLVAGGILGGVASSPWVFLLGAFAIMAVKSFATAATNDGGGVAGDFAPTIMIGSVAGFFYAGVLNDCFGMSLPVADYVFMGMAGILAGAVRAPLMAMFLVTEMATTGYGQFVPVAIVASLSYLTVCLFRFIGRKRSQGSPHGGCKDPRREGPPK